MVFLISKAARGLTYIRWLPTMIDVSPFCALNLEVRFQLSQPASLPFTLEWISPNLDFARISQVMSACTIRSLNP